MPPLGQKMRRWGERGLVQGGNSSSAWFTLRKERGFFARFGLIGLRIEICLKCSRPRTQGPNWDLNRRFEKIPNPGPFVLNTIYLYLLNFINRHSALFRLNRCCLCVLLHFSIGWFPKQTLGDCPKFVCAILKCAFCRLPLPPAYACCHCKCKLSHNTTQDQEQERTPSDQRWPTALGLCVLYPCSTDTGITRTV
jgi:hypothetical protein